MTEEDHDRDFNAINSYLFDITGYNDLFEGHEINVLPEVKKSFISFLKNDRMINFFLGKEYILQYL